MLEKSVDPDPVRSETAVDSGAPHVLIAASGPAVPAPADVVDTSDLTADTWGSRNWLSED
ncbi:MAG: hypothetical protein ABI828_06580 [Actinomycetota bacterium]